MTTTTLVQTKAKRTSTRDIGFVEVCLPWADEQKPAAPVSKPRQWATEVETSGQFGELWAAATRLGQSDALNKRLKVPQRFMGMAAMVLMRAGVSAWVRNMSGNEEFFVKAVKA
jgi:hypothetical protein